MSAKISTYVGISVRWLLLIQSCQCFSTIHHSSNGISVAFTNHPNFLSAAAAAAAAERSRHETLNRNQHHRLPPSILSISSTSKLNGVPFFADSVDDEETKTTEDGEEKVTARANEQTITSSQPSILVNVKPVSGSPESIRNAATFMVESFWLGSPLNMVDGEIVEVSDSTKKNLIDAQEVELMDTYGERMGKRLLPTGLLLAYDTEDPKHILGMVGIETTLLDTRLDEKFLSYESSEKTLKNTIASLGPKQRREYKNKSLDEISAELLPSEVGVVSCLSNLSVSPDARRKGIAEKLCREAQQIIENEWGFENMYLKVEKANTGAQYLYRSKLNFSPIFSYDSVALRVDPTSGSFVSRNVETVIMGKEF